jgi:hypothetical protein
MLNFYLESSQAVNRNDAAISGGNESGPGTGVNQSAIQLSDDQVLLDLFGWINGTEDEWTRMDNGCVAGYPFSKHLTFHHLLDLCICCQYYVE